MVISEQSVPLFSKDKKSLTVSWSDEDDSNDEVENESGKHASAFAGRVMSDTKSYEEELSYDELAISYHELIAKNADMNQMLEKQGEIISQLQSERSKNFIKISELNDEVIQLNSQLEQVKLQVRVMTTGTNVLDDCLEVENIMKPKGTCFDYRALNRKQCSRNSAYTPEDCGLVRQPQPNHKSAADAGSDDLVKLKPMLKHSNEHRKSNTKKKINSWICDHCKGISHIRPYCFKLHGRSEQYQLKPTKMKWIPRSANVGLIVQTSLKASSNEDWYFDSGCSRHMTGEDKYLEDVRLYAGCYVTFGDGAKGRILGIGNLIKHGMPRLDNVLLVKRLTANLFSITQLCDQGFVVNFSRPECQIIDKEGEVIMKGTRSKDNCYLWVSQEEAHLSTCLISKEEEVKLWDQKLGHLHLKGMKKALSLDAIRGLPDLKIIKDNICGEFQIGKQTRMSHPRLEHHVTSKVLKLLHMDLMEHMQL